jgi:hypothetical protein
MVIMPGLSAVIWLTARASAETVVRCASNPAALQPALAAAPAGETVRIEGTCRGTFVVDRNLTLSGRDDATLDGNGTGPVLTVAAGSHVVVENLIVTGGVSSAPVAVGGIANAGRLELRRSTVRSNAATGESRATGGIESGPADTASLLLDRTVVADNRATARAAGQASVVAGVRNTGPGTLIRSEIRGNTAFASSEVFNRAFGGMLIGAGDSRIENTVIRDNVARSEHTGGATGTIPLIAGAIGAIGHLQGASLVISRSEIRNNRAISSSAVSSGSAGAIASGGTVKQLTTLIDTEVIDNIAEAVTYAVGGVGNNSTTFVLERSTFRGNRASATAADGRAVGGIGSGFFGASRTKLVRSRVTANAAKASAATGGLHQIVGNSDYELERTTVSANTPVNCNFDCQR